MTRGTTPTLTVVVNGITLSNIASFYLTLEQGSVQIIKTNDDIEVNDDIMTVKLTQEDTLAFQAGPTIKIQLRAMTVDGNAIASKIGHLQISDILQEGEIE